LRRHTDDAEGIGELVRKEATVLRLARSLKGKQLVLVL
jgi:hypothetical protein